MISLLGFTTAYISLAKTLIPSLAAGHVADPATLPTFLQNTSGARILWASVFAFCLLLPLACAQELSMLRYTSLLGVICSLLILLVMIGQFSCNKEVVPEPMTQLTEHAVYWDMNMSSVVTAVPFIIFLYM